MTPNVFFRVNKSNRWGPLGASSIVLDECIALKSDMFLDNAAVEALVKFKGYWKSLPVVLIIHEILR